MSRSPREIRFIRLDLLIPAWTASGSARLLIMLERLFYQWLKGLVAR